jgi:hypothetical protein
MQTPQTSKVSASPNLIGGLAMCIYSQSFDHELGNDDDIRASSFSLIDDEHVGVVNPASTH